MSARGNMTIATCHNMGMLTSNPLPLPDGKPVPLFFGRRFMTANEIIATGLVRNLMTLRRLISEGRFPPPLALGRKLRLWDALELQALVDRLAAARATDGKRPATTKAAGQQV
jgi:predicted DNA-binding transcriptional regulator AlpA